MPEWYLSDEQGNGAKRSRNRKKRQRTSRGDVRGNFERSKSRVWRGSRVKLRAGLGNSFTLTMTSFQYFSNETINGVLFKQ